MPIANFYSPQREKCLRVASGLLAENKSVAIGNFPQLFVL